MTFIGMLCGLMLLGAVGALGYAVATPVGRESWWRLAYLTGVLACVLMVALVVLSSAFTLRSRSPGRLLFAGIAFYGQRAVVGTLLLASVVALVSGVLGTTGTGGAARGAHGWLDVALGGGGVLFAAFVFWAVGRIALMSRHITW